MSLAGFVSSRLSRNLVINGSDYDTERGHCIPPREVAGKHFAMNGIG